MRRRIARGVARLTFDKAIRAVQLDEQIRRRAGTTMETIDVLRHDRDDLPRALERHDGMVHGVRLRVLIDLPRFQLEVPVLDSRRF